MKKTLLIAILAIFAFSIVNAETKISMELWNRWTYETIDGEVQKNGFSLERGYFRLEPVFSSKIKGRFNLDFFSSSKSTDTDGAGIKLKYAYLDFSELIPLKNSKVTVGLMKTYFGTIYDWNYTTIDKDPSDKYGFVSSTDYGVGFSGYLPSGFGTYDVAVYNGEGYKKAGSNINKDMNFAGNIRLIPIVGVTIGGSYMMKTKNDSEIDDGEGNMIDNPDREEYALMAGVGKFAFGPVSILAQYLNKVKSKPNVDSYDDVTSTVISVMPVFKVNNSFDIIARYDIYDPNTDADDDGSNTIIAGVNYNIKRNSKNSPVLFVQANYETTTFEDDSDAVNQIMLQLRWKFSETMK
ncbi:MAG: hypothetical protein JW996_04440 [Candidatus Cloacimonetes bacterium]|nr:hypothetical protein [Candidatus Cloacimonadota bacterium]